MSYKNSSIYVQKQINRLLRRFRRFVRVYVNNIIIFFKTTKKHIAHFCFVFGMLQTNNIFIKFNKVFLSYFNVALLNQKVNFFDLSINVKKLKVIIKIQFFKIFRSLKIYFDFIDYFREYVFFYVDVFKILQIKKIELLKLFSVFDNVKKAFFSKTKIENSTQLKKEFFCILQSLLSASIYFIHYNSMR